MAFSRKNILFLAVLTLVLVFSGCGQKKVEEKKSVMPSNETVPAQQSSSKTTDNSATNLPAPTGNVSDAVDSVIKASDSESVLIDQEDADADVYIDDSRETDDFSQSYTGNEF